MREEKTIRGENLIKSKQRVRQFAEVFTPAHIVKDMCDLIPSEIWNNIDSTFLEPACGTGNFCAEILRRKLALAQSEDDVIRCYKSIYGIDIQADNVQETKDRMLSMVPDYVSAEKVKRILDLNFVCGDAIEIMKRTEDCSNAKMQ